MLRIAAVVAQFAILGWMVFHYAQPMHAKTEIVVRTGPVDPRDMFRGDYVILSYPMNTPLGVVGADRSIPGWKNEMAGRTVYAEMEPDPENPGLWRLRKATLQRPASGIYLTGMADYRGRVNYGIEQFYVPEGEGKNIERIDRRSHAVEVTLGVMSDGRASVKDVKIVKLPPGAAEEAERELPWQ